MGYRPQYAGGRVSSASTTNRDTSALNSHMVSSCIAPRLVNDRLAAAPLIIQPDAYVKVPNPLIHSSRHRLFSSRSMPMLPPSRLDLSSFYFTSLHYTPKNGSKADCNTLSYTHSNYIGHCLLHIFLLTPYTRKPFRRAPHSLSLILPSSLILVLYPSCY